MRKKICKTSRFHLAVRVNSDNAWVASKRGKNITSVRQDFHTAPYINYTCIWWLKLFSLLEQGQYDSDARISNVWGCAEIFPVSHALGCMGYLTSATVFCANILMVAVGRIVHVHAFICKE